MPHPPYSFDLASGDFYLFPTIKEKLERIQLADDDRFFAIVSALDRKELNAIFQAWVQRVHKVSAGTRDYV
jgi:hypothetical protein